LQHLLRIFEKVPELVPLVPQHLRRQLRGHLDSSNRTVFGHKADLVDLDARVAGKRRLQLLR